MTTTRTRHPRLSHRAALRAVYRRTALRAAGVPNMVPSDAAYYLTGGVMGTRPSEPVTGDVPLASIAQRVPDAEAFLPDYRGHVLRVLRAE